MRLASRPAPSLAPAMEGEGLTRLARAARRRLLKMHFESRIGHLGGNLSALDALLVLHHRSMRADDVFILSKGHAAGALYVTLWSLGVLTEADLATFHGEATRLAGHPVGGWSAHIPVGTGSLGHGLPVALGMAFKRHVEREPGRIYCLTSDGEWQEGAMWEALIFWAHRALKNLTVLVDVNGLQGFGTTREVASMQDLGRRIASFGVAIVDIDGHDLAAIEAAVQAHPGAVILLHTVKGKGVSFMENRLEWHYLPLSAEQYAAALRELEEPATAREPPASSGP